MTKEPSEAAMHGLDYESEPSEDGMREAAIFLRTVCLGTDVCAEYNKRCVCALRLARALDRQAAAQREKDAKIAVDAYPCSQTARSIAAIIRSPEPGWQPTHRHKMRGGAYVLVGTAEVQAPEDAPLTDYECVQVYRAENGRLWVRRMSEFRDKFDEIAAAIRSAP